MKPLLMMVASLMLVASVQAASFDCVKAETKVEKLICADETLSKLDEELNAAYKAALQDVKQADSIKQSQKRWMKDRNGCSDVACVRNTYLMRNEQLQLIASSSEQTTKVIANSELKSNPDQVEGESNFDSSAFKGEYILMRAWPGESVCQQFKNNLNRFRKLDFDQCNPRLSDKFHQFSRPYQWKEIPFDMALAEKAIRSTVDLAQSVDPEGLAYHRKLQEDRWLEWKKGSEPFRALGEARMWLTKVDIDGDGQEDTILRMTPGGRLPIDLKRPSLWSCDYNIGELYVIDSANARMAASFNSVVGGGSDIIHFADNNHYYLLTWNTVASTALQGWFNQGIPSVGGTRGVTLRTLYQGPEHVNSTPVSICLIDWVPTGHYIPALPQQHKRSPVTQ